MLLVVILFFTMQSLLTRNHLASSLLSQSRTIILSWLGCCQTSFQQRENGGEFQSIRSQVSSLVTRTDWMWYNYTEIHWVWQQSSWPDEYLCYYSRCPERPFSLRASQARRYFTNLLLVGFGFPGHCWDTDVPTLGRLYIIDMMDFNNFQSRRT